MNASIFFGGSVIAAVVAGAIALLAPCCISAMLPAYFATSFQNRRRLVAMSFVFAGGIATVILPIALGATAVRRLIFGGHTVVYVLGGALMLSACEKTTVQPVAVPSATPGPQGAPGPKGDTGASPPSASSRWAARLT